MFGVFRNLFAVDDRRFQFLGPDNFVRSVTRRELEDLAEEILSVLREDDDRSHRSN